MSEGALKIAVSGKGGVGKTTIAALLVRHLAAAGRRVLAIDADPVASLGAALAMPGHTSIAPIVTMHDLIHERTGVKPGSFGSFFKMNPRVDDIPDRFAAVDGNIHLMVMGTVDHGGKGCVCPESVLLKTLVTHVLLYRDDALVMDMEAGVEHLGRATARAVDVMLVVVEPGARSIQAAQMIQKLAADIGVTRVVAVANKVRSPEDEAAIVRALGDIPLVGSFPYDAGFVEADLTRTRAFPDGPPPAVAAVLDAIVAAATAA